ncbi:MAG: hypothetical protein HGA96_15460 [Desulfobulbaceae bacterium]|nr:hypothetical protein [Desulfobulbaceae bacterium]
MIRPKHISRRPEAPWLLILASGLLAIFLYAPSSQAANFGAASSVDLTALAEPNQVVSGDFDGDNKLDLAFVSVADNKVRLRNGDDLGGFTSPWTDLNLETGGGDGPFALAVGDFDKDGNQDIAVANVYSDNVSVFLGKGDGTFFPASVYNVGVNPTAITAADFDGDTFSDLAVTNYGDDTLSVLLNDGTGLFAAAVDYATGSGPWALTNSILTASGKQDLIVANYAADTVSILTGNGDGTFDPKSDKVVGAGPTSVITGDFDEDGNLDVAVTNFADDTVSVLIGNGLGGFAAGVAYDVGLEPISVASEDFNGTVAGGGDGKLDLAVANRGDDNVLILRGNGDGTFTFAADYTVGLGPSSVITADLNGDSILDLVTANRFDDTGSVLLAQDEDDAPTGSISIDEGVWIDAVSVNLTLTATEDSGGAIEMKICNTSDCSDTGDDADYIAFAATRTWDLLAGDGLKTVYAWFRDARSNESAPYFATIILDSTAPGKPIVINNNEDYANSHDVTLSLGGAGSTEMRICNSADCSTLPHTAWIPYAATYAWTLPANDGTKTVYAEFRNLRNTSTQFFDRIIVDTTAPTGTITIDSGKSTAFDTAVNLTLQALEESGGAISMCINNTGTNTEQDPCAPWEAFASSKAWTLTAGAGTKTVYAWFKDTRGNVSTTKSDTIILTNAQPTGSIVINNGDLATIVVAATLDLTMSANVIDMCVSNSNVTPCTVWTPARTTLDWTLASADDGLKTVYAWFRTEDGIVSEEYSDTIQMDKTPPTDGSISINSGDATTNSTTVNLTLSATDATTVVATMCISNTATCLDWVKYAPSLSWTLESGDGEKTVSAWFKDAQNNATVVAVTDTIILDATAPDGTVVINAADASTGSREVTLTLAATDDSNVTDMCISNATTCAEGTGWLGYTTSYSSTVTLAEGEKLVVAQTYKILSRTTLDFTLYGAANNNVGTTFTASSAASAAVLGVGDSVRRTTTLSEGATLVVGRTYKITAHATLDFTTCGAANNTVGTTFVASSGATLLAGDTVLGDFIKDTWTLASSDGTNALSAGEKLVIANTYIITARTTLDFTKCGAPNNTVGTMFTATKALVLGSGDSVSRTAALAAGASLVTSKTYKITGRATLDFTAFGAANNNVGTTFVATSATLSEGATLVISKTYKIAGRTTLDFTTCGAANNTVGTTFVASSAAVLGAGDSVSTVAVLGAGDTVIGWSLASGDGTKTVNVWFKDEWGNATATGTPKTDSILLDTTAPTAGSISIDSAAAATASTTVSLTLSATDATEVAEMCISNAATCTAWEALASPKSWTLTSGDGIKTVRAWFKDALGNANATSVTDTITLDQTAPTGSVVINNAATSTTTAAVTLTLAAAGASHMCISNTNDVVTKDSCPSGGWLAYATSKPWTLSDNDGTKTVYVWFKDALDNTNTTAYSDSIILDSTAPTLGTISINSAAAFTKSTAVTLTLSATDATQMCISNTTTCADTAWVAYAVSKAWVLTTGAGLKEVFVKYRDAYGNVAAQVSDTITLDVTVPANGTVVAANGVGEVALSWSGFSDVGGSGVASYKVVSSTTTFPTNCTGTAIYAGTELTYTNTLLTNGNTYYYRVCALDTAGNMSSGATAKAMAVTEIAPPTGTISINAGAAATKTAAVTLTLSATDDSAPIQMCVSNVDPAVTPCTTYLAYATTKAWTLSTGNGAKTVYVKFKDKWGNTAEAISDGITLDAIAPTNGALAITAGNAKNDLTWSGFADTAGSGIASYKVVFATTAAPASCATGTVIYNGPLSLYSHTVLTNGTTYYYRVCATDVAGNISTGAIANAKPKPEFVAPTGSVVIAGGDTYAKAAAVTLTLTIDDAPDNSSPYQMCVSNIDPATTACTSYSAYAATKAWSLTTGNGTKTVYVKLRDKWGNTSDTYSDTITLDATAPTGGSLVVTAIDTQSDLAWSGFTDPIPGSGISSYKVVFSTTALPASCAVGTTIYSGTDTSYQHTGLTNGTTYYYRACAIDDAGNTSTGATATGRWIPETDPPTDGTVSINGGNSYTNTLAATLSLSATDASAMGQMCVSNTAISAATCSPWVAYATSKAWTLASGTTTPKTVNAWFKDEWGNTSAMSTDSIGYDITRPIDGTATATPGAGQITLNWASFGDALSGLAGYKIVSATSSAPTSCSTGTVVYTGAVGVTTFTNLGLTSGTRYYYRICATDNAGNISLGVTANAIPSAP